MTTLIFVLVFWVSTCSGYHCLVRRALFDPWYKEICGSKFFCLCKSSGWYILYFNRNFSFKRHSKEYTNFSPQILTFFLWEVTETFPMFCILLKSYYLEILPSSNIYSSSQLLPRLSFFYPSSGLWAQIWSGICYQKYPLGNLIYSFYG